MPLRSFSQAEIVLSHRRRLELPLLLTVWLGVAAFSLAEGNIFYVLAGTLAVAVNMLAVSRDKEVYVRRVLVNAGVLAATAVLILELAGGGAPLLVTLGHYLILIQLCKLFEQKRDRDYVQLLAMSILLMVAGTIICDRMWFAAAMLLYIALVSHTAMVFTLKRGLDAAAAARLVTEPDPMHPRLVAWNVIRDWPARALRNRLAIVLVAILATGVAMFLLAPRAAWGGADIEGVGGRKSTTGFKSHVRLGEAEKIYLSDEALMTVTIRPTREGQTIPATPLYLRGKTLEVYSNSTWSGSTGIVGAPPDQILGETIAQEITINPGLLPTLFSAYPTVRCECPGQAIRFDSDLNVTMPLHTWPRRATRYTAWSWVQPLTDQQRQFLQRHRDAPRGDPAAGVEATPPVRQLAVEWCRDLLVRRQNLQPGRQRDELDLAVARRIEEKLRSNYEYSLDLSASNPDRDGVEDFLFYMKKGHCEYFASALAVMCRSVGVHARVAVGFRPQWPAEPNVSFPVRGRDAHAWAEVFTPSTDWVIVDATPGGQQSRTRHWWSRLEDAWQTLRFAWNEKVLGYDEAAREHLGRWLAGLYGGVKDAIVHAFRTLRKSAINLLIHGHIDKALSYLSLALSVLGVFLLAVVIARAVRRELHYSRLLREGKIVPWPQLSFFRRLLSLLKRHGVEFRRDLTPREHVARAAETLHLPAGVMNELVDLYYSLRWGLAQAPPEKIRAAEEQVAEIDRMLKNQKPRPAARV